MDVAKNIYLPTTGRLVLVLTTVSLIACSEPETVFRPDPRRNFGYPPPPGGYGYYQPPEEDEPNEEENPDSNHTQSDDSASNRMDEESEDSSDRSDSQSDRNNAAPTPSDLPTARSVGNGRVESPYAPGKQVDVQGFPPGSTVRDPYTNQLFIVPLPQNGSRSPEQ
jgi:hypothetical protein